MAYYLAALLGLYDLAGRISKMSSAEIAQKLPGIPAPLLGGMLERFTEASGKKRSITEKTKLKLLAWICVAYLHLDEFSVEVGKLASELRLPPAKWVIDSRCWLALTAESRPCSRDSGARWRSSRRSRGRRRACRSRRRGATSGRFSRRR